ncbi:hypothetical protein BH09BAC2_BH09BAC2_02340 [soil metagenome]
MKKFPLLFLSFIIAQAAFSQDEASDFDPIAFRTNIEFGFPIGNNVQTYSFIIGASAEVEYRPIKPLGLTAKAGYLLYTGSSLVNGKNEGMIPVMGGFKAYTHSAFLHAQAGAAFPTASGAKTNFAFSVGLGHRIIRQVIAEVKFMEVKNSLGHLNHVGVSVGYTFR